MTRGIFAGRSNLFGPLAAGLLLAALPGCGGPEMATVKGKVLYNGQPLKFGNVMFQPPEGPAASGDIQPDGSFALETPGKGPGVLLGKSLIRVTCYEAQRPSDTPGAEQREMALGKSLIPMKYTDYSSSELVRDVQPGENNFTLDLKGP